MTTNPFDLVDLLGRVVSHGGSDLHLSVDSPPMARIHGSLTPLGDRALTADFCRELILGILTEPQRARLEEDWELDFAVQIQGLGRFRANAHYNRGALEAAFRHIPQQIPELTTLGHRSAILEICTLQRGLVLVTGTTGSGKSTTMASMIQSISQQRDGVIVTIEDPIEYIFQNSRSIVKQREVGSDTKSFNAALRHVLRQDPDVILIGEMRDTETVSTAISAAETGHLVIATMHTVDAPQAIDRIVDSFSSEQQPQIIAQLSNSLEAIIAQRLIPREDAPTRILASEILTANTGVRSCIRERRWEQIAGLIEIGTNDGMHTFDNDLERLYLGGYISKENAIANARSRKVMEELRREPAPRQGIFN